MASAVHVEHVEIEQFGIGGNDARLGQLPYVALIQVSSKSGDDTICGGVIISLNSILTSGTCAYVCRKSSCDVFVGTVDINSGGQRLTIANTIVHNSLTTIFPHDFDFSALNKIPDDFIDLGILIMKEIPISKNVKIIDLPTEAFTNGKVFISGAGDRSVRIE